MGQPRSLRTFTAPLAAVVTLAAGASTAQPAPSLAPSPLAVTYEIETLRTGPLPPDIVKRMEPLHSLGAVENLLKENRVAFAWSYSQVSRTAMPAELVKQLDALPPHEVFVMPQSSGWTMGVVLSKH